MSLAVEQREHLVVDKVVVVGMLLDVAVDEGAQGHDARFRYVVTRLTCGPVSGSSHRVFSADAGYAVFIDYTIRGRNADFGSKSDLTRVFPPELVDEVIDATGRWEQRHRSLPARVMAYFAVGIALHSEGSCEDVLGLMTDGLSWADSDAGPVALPTKAAIFQARKRLGAEPVAALFDRVAAPLATEDTPGAWLAGRRLVAIDGTCLDVADTDVNDEYFGRPGVNKGERSAFPQARLVGVGRVRHPRHRRRGDRPVHDRREHAGPRTRRPVRAGNVGAGRPRILRFPLMEPGRWHRRGPVVAGECEHEAQTDRNPR